MAFSALGLLAVVAVLFSGTGVNSETPSCCQFDSAITSNEPCPGWNAIGWYHYPDKVPSWAYTKQEIPYFSDYEWAQDINAATLTSITLTEISSTSIISFQYYGDVDGTSSHLSVLFQQAGYPAVTVALLGDSLETWDYYTIDCSVTQCCVAGVRCDGTLTFNLYYAGLGEHALFAVDDVETGGGCHDFSCCTFLTSDFCGLTELSTNLPWKWSGVQLPDLRLLLPTFAPLDPDYAWFQLNGGYADVNSVLISPEINDVDNSFYFSVDYYIEINPDIRTNDLNFFFEQSGGYTRVLLTSLTVTGTGWLSATFYCSTLATGSCCAAGPGTTCSGSLQIDAGLASGVVFYAIDNLGINGACSATKLQWH